MRFGIRSVLAAGKIWRAILLGLVPIALVIPGGNVALSQSTTGSSSFTITPFDCPNSTATRVFGINNNGDIVGAYFDSQARWHGFLRYAGGTTCNTIDPPGSTFTEAHGINNTGQIVGNFTDANGKHGFLYDGSKVPPFTSINVSGARETYAWGINGGGQIVGTFKDNTNGSLHGFVRDAVGGVLPFDFDPNSLLTMAFGINDSGQIVGRCLCGSPFGEHGFVGKPGAFLQFDLPNTPTFQIWPWGINGPGQIAGYIEDLNFNWHGFVRYPTGTSTVFDVQNAPFGTFAQGINDTGQVVGYFVADRTHGFFGKPDPRLTVPQWYQAGVPNPPGCPDPTTGSLAKCPQGWTLYPGNFWGQWLPQQGQFRLDTDSTTTSIDMCGTANDPAIPLPFHCTIRGEGCALTAYVMVLNFFKRNFTSPSSNNPLPGIPPLDPATPQDPRWPNNWKDALFQSPGGQLKWNNFKSYPEAGLTKVYLCTSTSCGSYPSFSPLPSGSSLATADPSQTLINILRNGVPVVLPLLDVSNKEDHFVVVTGWDSQRGDFLVNDPGDINVKYLNDVWLLPVVSYNPKDANGNPTKFTQLTVTQSLKNIGEWKVYTDHALSVLDPLTPQALGIYTQDPVEFVLTDPQGRRTGFDPVTSTSFQEIPASEYANNVYSDVGNVSLYPPFKSLDMAVPMAGQYTLKVIGTGSGPFTVEVDASDAAGNRIAQTYSGTAAPGVSSQFTFQGTAIAFAAFSATLAISPTVQGFAISGTFTLGPGGTISPVTQPVTIQLGNYMATIPAGSFAQTDRGTFTFAGTIQGVLLAAQLAPTGINSYSFAIGGALAPTLPSANPVDVRLAIGNNGGDTSVNATFLP